MSDQDREDRMRERCDLAAGRGQLLFTEVDQPLLPTNSGRAPATTPDGRLLSGHTIEQLRRPGVCLVATTEDDPEALPSPYGDGYVKVLRAKQGQPFPGVDRATRIRLLGYDPLEGKSGQQGQPPRQQVPLPNGGIRPVVSQPLQLQPLPLPGSETPDQVLAKLQQRIAAEYQTLVHAERVDAGLPPEGTADQPLELPPLPQRSDAEVIADVLPSAAPVPGPSSMAVLRARMTALVAAGRRASTEAPAALTPPVAAHLATFGIPVGKSVMRVQARYDEVVAVPDSDLLVLVQHLNDNSVELPVTEAPITLSIAKVTGAPEPPVTVKVHAMDVVFEVPSLGRRFCVLDLLPPAEA